MRRLSIFLILLAAISTQLAQGQSKKKNLTKEEKQGLLNKLLAPGPLMIGHQNLEHKDCLKCHVAGAGLSDQKCLDCHKEIKRSVAKGNTFHAMHKKKCYQCHTDHKGRSHDTTIVNQKTFNHNLTGYKLEGKHSGVKCAECHTRKRTGKPIRSSGIRYFDTSRSCNSCHMKDDIHYFKGKWAKKDCGSCHNVYGWDKTTKFDHGRETGYYLKGNHARLSCNKCHAPNGKKSARYDWPIRTKQCLSCHKDIHGQNLSPKFQGGSCDKCHNQNKWSIPQFDHSITGYPLKGAHAKIKCTDCHVQSKPNLKPKDFKYRGLDKQCASCHDDYHSFDSHRSKRYGSLLECQHCHNESFWNQSIDFNHNYDTRWDITGKHKTNKCFDCHVPRTKQRVRGDNNKIRPKQRLYHWPLLTTKTCENCHKNPHTKVFSKKLLRKKCTECHVTDGWYVFRNAKKGFDHDATRFPLTGKHRKVDCDECHLINKKQVFRFPNAEKKFCINCHKNVHKKQFHPKFYNKACIECHTTNDFKRLKTFNHSKTRFPLIGRHKEVEQKCGKCHIKTKNLLPTKPPRRALKFKFDNYKKDFCTECHRSPHKNQFREKFYEAKCTLCHTNKNFTKRKAFNHNLTRFELRYKHKKVKCDECHIKTKAILSRKPLKRKSKFVWKNLKTEDCKLCHEDVHNGELGPRCSECHTEKGFEITRDFHRNFNLSGVHFTLQCAECHIDNRRLGGMSEQCQVCHLKDDVHNMTLPNCQECHRQHFWEITAFRHSMSNFPLRGAHRVLTCASCHADGIYQGKPSECIDCHTSDLAEAQARIPSHTGPNFIQCEQCHNQFIFEDATRTE